MRSFASLLPSRPTSLVALAAELLDHAGVWPEYLRQGVTILECPIALAGDISDAIDALVFNDEAGRGWNADGQVILLDGHVDDFHFKRVLARGVPVIVVAPAGKLPSDAGVHQDRRYVVDGDISDDIVKRVVESVTGGDVPNSEARGLSRNIDPSTLTATVRPTISAEVAVERLRKLAAKADEDRQRALARLAEVQERAAAPPPAAPAKSVVTKLSDLSGFGAARAWGLQLADDLQAYAANDLDWEDVDRGILLVGAPGVGKTFFVKALAAECGIPLIQASYADMESSASSWQISKAIRKKFDEARKRAPCIVFMDELDSYGVRGANAHNDSFWGALINSLLAELDGAVPRDGVVVIGATNHPDRVDPALKRPGRLERTVEIPLPDTTEIGAIIKHHLSSPIGDGMLSEAALACRGMSPAMIAMLCREARRAARRRGAPVVPHDVMQAAWESRPKRDDADDLATCRHEAAHAVAAVVLGVRLVSVEVDGQPHCATILSTHHATREVTEHFIIMMLAARRADAMLGDGVTAGAVADLASATDLARNAVAKWGLTGSVYAHGETEATLDQAVRQDVRDMLEDCDLKAAKLVDAHREAILRVAEALRVRRYLDAEEVKEIVSPGKSLS